MFNYYQHLVSDPSAIEVDKTTAMASLPLIHGNSVVFLFTFAACRPCLPPHSPLEDGCKRTAFLYFRRNRKYTFYTAQDHPLRQAHTTVQTGAHTGSKVSNTGMSTKKGEREHTTLEGAEGSQEDKMLADKTFLWWLPNCSLPVLFPSCPFWGKTTCFSDTINTTHHRDSLLVWALAPPFFQHLSFGESRDCH